MSIEDGVAKDVDFDNEEVTISGLKEDTTYYFVVFTSKTQSEPYIYTTGTDTSIFRIKVQAIQSALEDNFKEVTSYSKVTS